MTIAISNGLKAARMQGAADYINSGGAAGYFAVYAGTRPALITDAPGTTPLVLMSLAYPCGSVSGVTLTLAGGDPGLILQSGVASWARLFTSDGDTVLDCDCGTAGPAELILDNLTLYAGAEVRFTSATLG